MRQDRNDHYLLYHVLGFTDQEAHEIDLQQNIGRYLYKYTGSLMEKLAIRCIKEVYPEAKEKVKLENTIDRNPRNVEIDCLVGDKAYEIKWKDATTDGDHVNKEKKRVEIIKKAGYIPVRIMFFEPNREEDKKIQRRLKKLYEDLGGEYYSGEAAWKYLRQETGIDLRQVLENFKER